MSTNVLVNQSKKLRSMDGWYIQKARVESSQSSFAFESVIKVSFLLPKFLGLVINETNRLKYLPRTSAVTNNPNQKFITLVH